MASPWPAVVVVCVSLCSPGLLLRASPKLDLPGSSSVGVAGSHGFPGSSVRNPATVGTVLEVKLVAKGSSPGKETNVVDAVVCVDSDGCRFGEVGRGGEEEEEEEEEKKKEPSLIVVDEEDAVAGTEVMKKKKKKKVWDDVPVIVGSLDVGNPVLNIPDIPVIPGLRLSPDFSENAYDLSVLTTSTPKVIPFGFDEPSLVKHVLETSPLITFLRSSYNPSVHQSRGDLATSYHQGDHHGDDILLRSHQQVAGFYGGVQPAVYPRPVTSHGDRGQPAVYPRPLASHGFDGQPAVYPQLLTSHGDGGQPAVYPRGYVRPATSHGEGGQPAVYSRGYVRPVTSHGHGGHPAVYPRGYVRPVTSYGDGVHQCPGMTSHTNVKPVIDDKVTKGGEEEEEEEEEDGMKPMRGTVITDDTDTPTTGVMIKVDDKIDTPA